MSRESAIIFDDGSLESKVLQFELKTSYDLNVVQVKPFSKLDNWLAEVIDETDQIQKIFLHFPSEDYITTDLRDEVNRANHLYPLLRIVPWYEKASRDSLKHRATNYGIEQTFKAIKQTEVASDILKGGPDEIRKEAFSDEFIDKLKGTKPEFPSIQTNTPLVDPDDEMKEIAFKTKKEEFKDKRRRKKVA